MTAKSVAPDKNSFPRTLPGYEQINRFWDPLTKRINAKILPGEVYVSTEGELISTVLGSCIAVCIRDQLAGVGGMNHFMLPRLKGAVEGVSATGGDAARYGNWAMEFLINEILKNGGRRERLEIKVFGGGQVLSEMEFMDVGQANIDFVFSYLMQENFSVKTHDVGGVYPRKVQYFSESGVVRVKRFRKNNNNTVSFREKDYAAKLNVAPKAGDITLFD